MRRREFITLFGALAAWPLTARAQQSTRLPTVGVLGAGTLSAWSPWVAAFVQRLRELGWTEGRTIAIEYRWAEGRTERYAEIAGQCGLSGGGIGNARRRGGGSKYGPRNRHRR